MKAILKNLQHREIGAKRDKIGHNFYKEIAVIHPAHDCVARFGFTWDRALCIALHGSAAAETTAAGTDRRAATATAKNPQRWKMR